MSLVQEAAGRLQLRSKLRRAPDCNLRGGKIMSRGQPHHILTNPIYAGRIRHKRQVFDGQHPAIIDPERWDALQARLTGKASKSRNTKQHHDPSLLAGKIIDEVGERLTPSHAQKGKKRYRYYISQRLVTGGNPRGRKAAHIAHPCASIGGCDCTCSSKPNWAACPRD
jgi:hypothetical protein